MREEIGSNLKTRPIKQTSLNKKSFICVPLTPYTHTHNPKRSKMDIRIGRKSPLSIMIMVLVLLLGAIVPSVLGGFFDGWRYRAAFSGGYSQPGAFGRR